MGYFIPKRAIIAHLGDWSQSAIVIQIGNHLFKAKISNLLIPC